MYATLLILHSLVRWLVLAFLVIAIYRAYSGYISNAKFSKTDNAIRHWTATIAHIQLILGIIVYTQSPIIKYFSQNFSTAKYNAELLFFGLIHISLMIIAIVIITIGSALAKRKTTDSDKYKTMLLWFAIALVIIFIAIPWPFSPLAARPYFRIL